MTEEDTDPYAESGIQTPFVTENTAVIKVDGRTWEATPEEFKKLRDALNEINFKE